MVLTSRPWYGRLLVAILGILLFLERYWFKYILQPVRTLRRLWRSTTLKRLISNKEDEIWNAAIWLNDGEVGKLFEEFEERVYRYHEVRDPETSNFKGFRSGAPIATAVANLCGDSDELDITNNIHSMIAHRMKVIVDQLANTTRQLNEKEEKKLVGAARGKVSILWVAIDRHHVKDLDYLLRYTNIEFQSRNGLDRETVLHKAISQRNERMIDSILRGILLSSHVSYVDLGNWRSETPLHTLIKTHSDHPLRIEVEEESRMILMIGRSLLELGANVNALNDSLQTPLHLFFRSGKYGAHMEGLLKFILSEEAEVNSKDINGDTPLHLACKNQDRDAIQLLAQNGADLEILNHAGKTPRAHLKTPDNSDDDESFWRGLEILIMTGAANIRESKKLPRRARKLSKNQMDICQTSRVYCRLQENTRVGNTDIDVPLFWSRADHYVSNVLHPTDPRQNDTFLHECELKAIEIWKVVQNNIRRQSESSGEASLENDLAVYGSWKWSIYSTTLYTL